MSFAIDHIVIAVADLDRAIRDYEALGFTVLPGGAHPRGSRNALICFEDGAYLEIIAFAQPLPAFRWWQVLDRAGEGLVDYALLPDSLDVRLAQGRAGGLTIEGPIDGERLQPDGVRVLWRSARPPQADIPFLCEDVTPRALRVPEGAARQHRNGAIGVAGITVVVADLAVATARYRALLGQEPSAQGPVAGLGFGLAQFRVAGTILSLIAPGVSAEESLRSLLERRGEGAYALSFAAGEDRMLDLGLAHGARLELVRTG